MTNHSFPVYTHSMRSKLEQETIVRWDRTTDLAIVYTADPTQKRRLEKRGYQFKTLSSGSWEARVPKKSITLRSQRPRSTPKSPAQVADSRAISSPPLPPY